MANETNFVVFIVLILIFLENALRLRFIMRATTTYAGLNPYFFGKCSTAKWGHKKQEVVFKS